MFNSEAHKQSFLALCPGKLITDTEWIAPVFILTSDGELRSKTINHINSKHREIDWDTIMSTDFGSGHHAAILWAFALWAGNSWRWDETGKSIPPIDTMDKAFYMDSTLRRTAITALELRWGLRGIEL